MPMYDYRCAKCETEFESLQKMDIEEVICEVPDVINRQLCGGVALRQISRPRELTKLKAKLGDYANLSSLRFHFDRIDSD